MQQCSALVCSGLKMLLATGIEGAGRKISIYGLLSGSGEKFESFILSSLFKKMYKKYYSFTIFKVIQ